MLRPFVSDFFIFAPEFFGSVFCEVIILTEQDYMRIALELAEKGKGFTSPNPMVGAVIVKNDKIIGKGYHEKYGSLHAERNALKNCTENPAGADMYVTLEPCCHYGKQPPCVEAVIESGIKRVFIGSDDPNPLVSGKGAEILRNNGIEVYEHILKDECDNINKVFFHYITTKTPYIVMKSAISLDGKIACVSGDSKWITSEISRNHANNMRGIYSAICVGVNTVLADDPMLTCRTGGKDPVRIICDTNLKTPLDCNIVKSAKEISTVIATCSNDKEKKEQYENYGCKVIVLPDKNKKVDLSELMKKLGEMSIDSLIVEGGSELNWSFIESGLVNKVYTYIAPKFIGGKNAKTSIGGTGFEKMSDVLDLNIVNISKLGEDVLIESEVL